MGSVHDKRFPGESEEYRRARDELLAAEARLREQIEAVARQRRTLPAGGPIPEDYVFREALSGGGEREVRFSELFDPGKGSLVLYSYMYGPDWEAPCPMCSSMLDGLDGNAPHASQRVSLAVVAKAPPEKLRAVAEARGWRHLRMLSSHDNRFNADYNAEFESDYGNQHPLLHAFVRRGGTIRHFWSSEMLFVPWEGGNPRHVDSIWPLWSLFDVTPEGRGDDWYPKLRY